MRISSFHHIPHITILGITIIIDKNKKSIAHNILVFLKLNSVDHNLRMPT